MLVASGSGADTADLAIVIPARNEAARLPALLASLSGAGIVPAQLVVADDHSTDDTAHVARAHGATVVAVPPAPPGWQGKTFACATGAATSRATRLLFLDADVWFEPGGLARMLRDAPTEGAMSWCPHHAVRRPYEWLSLHFNVLMVAGTLARRGALFGQSLLITRSAYEAVGGHAAVRAEVLEHYALGKLLTARGIPALSAPGRGILAMRMYPDGIASLAAGWMKSFASGAAASPPSVLLASILWFSAGLTVAGSLVGGLATGSGPEGPTIAAFGLNVVATHWAATRVGTYPVLASLLNPIPLVFCIAVFTIGAVRRLIGAPMRWKGRDFGGSA